MTGEWLPVRPPITWLRSLVCVGALLVGGILQAGRAQTAPPDTQNLRPARIEQIRQRIRSIRRTPDQWRRRRARSRSERSAPPSNIPDRRGQRRGAQVEQVRLERRLEAIVRRVLAEELGQGRRPTSPERRPAPRTVLPETVRVTVPATRTDSPAIDRDSVRIVRDTLREIRVEQVERRLLDAGVFRAFEVNFAFGASALQPRATRTLDAVGKVLRRYPDLRLEVAGHTDEVGPDAFNQRLSEARAAVVRDYLIDQFDIVPDRLVARGYGETRPVAVNEERSGRALNRRVEFRVLNSEAAP